MGPAEFLRASRVVIVAGKGGVGKTTVAAALARLAADEGLRTLVVSVDGGDGLARLFGAPALGYAATALAPGIEGRLLTPDEALVDYLETHGLRRISKRLHSSGAMDVVATAAPGIRDILVLGKVKALERTGEHDLIVVDAPASGHAITFLSSARGIHDTARVGPLRAQAVDVLDLLADPARCSVVLVTIPEETPVNELVETAFALEDRVGVKLGPVVVNGVCPASGLDASDLGGDDALAGAARFRLAREAQQAAQIERLRRALPLPQVHLPFLFTTDLDADGVASLAEAFAAGLCRLP